MKTKRRTVFLCLAVLSMIAFSTTAATAAQVYLEGAYNDEFLNVFIYADFTAPELPVISYGVRLNFDPAELAFVSATKNSDFPPPYAGDPTPYTSNATVWELGTGDNRNNPAPALVGNAVVFKGGIINEANPGSSGVTDMERVFLGTVRFGPGTGAGGVIPAAPNLSLALAEDNGTYANFVQYVDGGNPPGVVLDVGVNFLQSVDIAQQGDANGDSAINSLDFGAIRNIYFGGGAPKAYADCNGDGIIDSLDFGCVRLKYFSSN